ncbi:hypothetical protein WR25_08357 [Diploscapter pachys]|uniref:Uncharacterized protein n=1 Tax=Diploscapter pachys TaxID=2018661 RepID=A0A2A2KH10_9BILA|nr:hypothetical protein WR25_08357 [Diploscapter pachys]
MRKSDEHIAKVAGIPYVPVQRETIEHSKTLCEVVRTKGLFKRLAGFWFIWFVSSICSYAVDFYSNTISGDLFVNQILFAVFIIVSKKMLLFVDTYCSNFKRRTLHQGSQLTVIILFAALTFLKIKEYTGVLFLVISLFGTVFMGRNETLRNMPSIFNFLEFLWDANYLCVVESMETACRTSALGSCSLVSRFGGILAPFLTKLASLWPPVVYLFVVVIGIFNLIISYLLLVKSHVFALKTGVLILVLNPSVSKLPRRNRNCIFVMMSRYILNC